VAEGALLPPFRLWFNWRFEGLERIPAAGPLIVAGNHLSYLDPFAHGYFVVKAGRRPRFLAKRELFENPFVGMVLRGQDESRPVPVAVTCGTAEENLANNRAVAAALEQQGYTVWLGLVRDGHNWTAWRDAFDPHLPTLIEAVS